MIWSKVFEDIPECIYPRTLLAQPLNPANVQRHRGVPILCAMCASTAHVRLGGSIVVLDINAEITADFQRWLYGQAQVVEFSSYSCFTRAVREKRHCAMMRWAKSITFHEYNYTRACADRLAQDSRAVMRHFRNGLSNKHDTNVDWMIHTEMMEPIVGQSGDRYAWEFVLTRE